MDWDLLKGFLAFAPPSGEESTQPWWTPMVPLLVMLFVFYFIFIRPQQRKAREHDLLIKTIRTGDKVLTSSGILGTVVGVKDRSVSIRSADAKLEVLKSAVTEITERTGDSAES